MKTPIQDWINANIPGDNLRHRDAGIDQGVFFRDQLGRCIARSYEEFEGCASVIGEHHSKSVKLPVGLFERPGLSVVVRDNFHDVSISVKRDSDETPEAVIIEKLVGESIGEKISSVYCQGFPEEWCFGSYLANKKRFTVQVSNKLEAYVLLRLIGLS